MRGLANFLEDLVLRPDFAHAILKRVCQFNCECTRRLLQAAKGKIHLIYTFDDLGTQKGPMVNPEILRKLLFPLHRKHNAIIHELGARVIFHSCGSVFPLIDDFIDMGVDILNALQPLAKDMEPRRLKERFGSRLSFSGGIDIQRLLPFGTADEVRKSVEETIAILNEGGGYILESAHAMQADTPAENIVAMYETARGEAITPCA
jgi:uroporphyrinogen decarboxylase